MTTTPAESVEAIFDRHLNAVIAHDLDTVMADYADDAVVLTPQGVVRGKSGVATFFETAVFPLLDDTFMQNFKVLRKDIDGDVVFLLWEVDGMYAMGADSFFFKDGKICAQTFAICPVAPSPA